ncbi:hypothetical protein RS666_08515 [Phocaeicola dorei]|jgi:hypothetical protein|uniref:hypothetical protein n=1 Tax=Phocaeicola dorei TaxID=357276 RepID=UPI0010591D05|nr:hypothetical protein [Phocaeicola dorei]MDV7061845.1 hypothetical protein [Phocaeicola dorei]
MKIKAIYKTVLRLAVSGMVCRWAGVETAFFLWLGFSMCCFILRLCFSLLYLFCVVAFFFLLLSLLIL